MSGVELTKLSPQERHKLISLPVNGQGLKTLVEAGMIWLKTNQQIVNNLNVFPVPDGDTGTNMVLTMQAAFDEIDQSGTKNIGQLARAIARGALMGARGNSGVILSQIWRGFARALDDQPTMDVKLLAEALLEAKETAYKGVVRPVEGTILTVIKDIAAQAEVSAQRTTVFTEVLADIVEAADASVERTPDLLPILKKAGVVDSGGKGLLCIFEGMWRFLNGDSLDKAITEVIPLSEMDLEDTMESVEPGQDYEVVIDFTPESTFDLENYYDELSKIGTSIQVGEGEGIYRMHIHVPLDKRYTPIDHTMTQGIIQKVMMENLVAQMEEKKTKKHPKINLAQVQPEETAVVAVSPGSGLSRIFASLGVAAIVQGGQTMNPSIKEVLASFENLPTDKVIILPNNKNIIMAAKEAASMTVKKVHVIPTISISQGISAMFRFIPDAELEENIASMVEAIDEVETGEITTATRSVEIDNVQVQKGQVIALHNGKLVTSTSNIDTATEELLIAAKTCDYERITLFYGEDMKLIHVNALADKIRSIYPDHEIEVHEGGQPHYQLIIAIE
ncbi:MAG: DAK2 domain-containing protein [Chloroflexota bacterium]|nr:DAK2 domain-containing protein [Chloroflexota bacterium]